MQRELLGTLTWSFTFEGLQETIAEVTNDRYHLYDICLTHSLKLLERHFKIRFASTFSLTQLDTATDRGFPASNFRFSCHCLTPASL